MVVYQEVSILKNILQIISNDRGTFLLYFFHCSTLGAQRQHLECLLPKTDKSRVGEDHKLQKRKKGGGEKRILMRAADHSVGKTVSWSCLEMGVWEERVSEGGRGRGGCVQHKQNSDNRGVCVINDPGAGSL